MPPVPVMIGPPPIASELDEPFDAETFQPTFVVDVDVLAESSKCSCSASDDNPY